MVNIQQWASRQLKDYDEGRPGTLFSEGVLLDVEEGYRLQSAVAELRRSRGECVIGYKVGCTSSTIRTQLGIDHCITGRLFDSERFQSGATLSRKRYANLAIEGELAVELSRTPEEQDFDGNGIPSCVAHVFPVIELHNYVLRGERPTAGELIANNAIHAGFVAGHGNSQLERHEEFAAGPVSISTSDQLAIDDSMNFRLLEECSSNELIPTIHSSLRWLQGILKRRGEQLSAGQIILTGSIASLIPIQGSCYIRVDIPPFGSVEASFVT